jgi:hypothetical protein
MEAFFFIEAVITDAINATGTRIRLRIAGSHQLAKDTVSRV